MLTIIISMMALSATAFGSTVKRLTEDDLINEADRIVTAILKEPNKSAWDSEFRRIYTTYSFEVQEDLAGTGEKSFDLVQPGGEVDGIGQRTEGFPTFNPGDRVVLFLRKIDTGYRVVGLSQGVFEPRKDNNSEKLVQRLEGLHLIGSDEAPLQIERVHLIKQIKRVWARKKLR